MSQKGKIEEVKGEICHDADPELVPITEQRLEVAAPPPSFQPQPQPQPQPDFLFKFLLIGNAYSGKSSFITRFVDNYFLLANRATIGLDFVRPLLHS
jgi:hypothetical protein